MKKGDVVMIYEDPYTKKIEEGKAEILRIHTEVDCMVYAEVEFEDGFVCHRRIEVE